MRAFQIIFSLFLSFFLVSNSAQGQILEPVKWKFSTKHVKGDEYDLIFTASIDDAWSVYSQHTSDDGPVPTAINYDNPEVVEFVGESAEVGHKKEGFDPLFDVNVIKFLGDKDYMILQRVKKKSDEPLVGYITFMTCDDETCLPPTDIDFSFTLGESAETGAASTEDQAADVASAKEKKDAGPEVKINIPTEKLAEKDITVEEMPEDVDDLYDEPADEAMEELMEAGEESMIQANRVGDKVDQIREELVETYEDPLGNCSSGEQEEENRSLWWLFIAGILGGFAALLTPCVFPMIPITVSFFTKDSKRKGWMNGLIYAASIVVIYVLLGLLITIVLGPEALNALSTSWIANVLFFIIFIVFAFSFFGFYEITLPSSWTTKTDSMADKGGLIGIFFMAATLALVSFSCTGPIVGSALVAAANGGIVGPLVVMLGFSLALSLPFGLFAAFPAWLNSLPKSGGWMNSVKVVLGFLELGLAFKFLSTADLTQHWGVLRYEPFMIILILVCVGIALYLFGFIKFPHDGPLKKLSITRKSIGTAFVLLGIYLSMGFSINEDTGIYKSLWLTSGFSPPVNYNFLLDNEKVDPTIKEKYPSFSKCANNIDCFKDYFEGMAYAKEMNKPALLDFTGHGCQNCRRTEDNIWVDNDIRSKLNDDVVLISLYVDDREKLEEPFVSLADGKKKRTVGARWADFQVVNFRQNSQPLYIMVTPEEEVITEPRGYNESIEDYRNYLDCGLNWYDKHKLSN